MRIRTDGMRRFLRPALLMFFLSILLFSSSAFAAKETRITISGVGDCTLGRNQLMKYSGSWNQMFAKKGSRYFLKRVSSYFKKDDLTIANLEGVLTRSGKRQKSFYRQSSGKHTRKKYNHLGKPSYVKALTSGGVDVVSFANNHNIDYGLRGFKDTLDACAKYDLPVACYDTVVRRRVNGLTVGIFSVDVTYCSRKLAEDFIRRDIADLRQDCDLIIACMHWGTNYVKKADKEQRTLGHLCVDLGADLVLGCHAHILQGIERYRGRYICYSLGNFTYGGRAVPKDIDTMIFQQTFTFVDGELVIDDNVKVLPCWMSTTKKVNDFRPFVRSGKAAREIIRKINARSKSYHISFDDSGRPKVSPAEDTELPAYTDSYPPLKAKKVPDIIRTLLK